MDDGLQIAKMDVMKTVGKLAAQGSVRPDCGSKGGARFERASGDLTLMSDAFTLACDELA